MLMVEVSMFPSIKGKFELYVSRVLGIIDKAVSRTDKPMGTVIEGEWDEVME
jgi:uncharacterized protein YqgV (UPF0045/DUF77 family)